MFYALNDVIIDAPDNDAYNLVSAIASGTTAYQQAAAQLATWH